MGDAVIFVSFGPVSSLKPQNGVWQIAVTSPITLSWRGRGGCATLARFVVVIRQLLFFVRWGAPHDLRAIRSLVFRCLPRAILVPFSP